MKCDGLKKKKKIFIAVEENLSLSGGHAPQKAQRILF